MDDCNENRLQTNPWIEEGEQNTLRDAPTSSRAKFSLYSY
jgi:hypothetical protein